MKLDRIERAFILVIVASMAFTLFFWGTLLASPCHLTLKNIGDENFDFAVFDDKANSLWSGVVDAHTDVVLTIDPFSTVWIYADGQWQQMSFGVGGTNKMLVFGMP